MALFSKRSLKSPRRFLHALLRASCGGPYENVGGLHIVRSVVLIHPIQGCSMGVMQITDLHIAPTNAGETLQRILDELDLPRVEARSGLRLSELQHRLRTYRHNEDQFHQGETILEHTQMVLEDLERVTVGIGYTDRQILNAVALFHDLGKAYTQTVEDGRFKYHRHAAASVLVLEAL